MKNCKMNEMSEKKKALSVTFHYRKNYGAFLQAWALQNFIGSSLINILDYRPSFLFWYPIFLNRKFKKRLPLIWHILAIIRYFQKNHDLFPFAEFKKLLKTKRYFSIKKINREEGVLICGSDQIWNPAFVSRNADVYFLNWGESYSRRIAYAASTGMKKWPIEFEQSVLPMLKRFDAISVREESSIPYLTSLGLKNIVCVCDPTILFAGNFYRKHFIPGLQVNKQYAFIYKIREDVPEAVIDILPENVVTVDLAKRNTVVSVTQWLGNIDSSKFVITDSYHGAIFCILLHKFFLVLPNRSSGKGMNERFATLLRKTDLEYRCLSYDEGKKEVFEKLNRPVDWRRVDEVLEEWRAYSGRWLKTALENSEKLSSNG